MPSLDGIIFSEKYSHYPTKITINSVILEILLYAPGFLTYANKSNVRIFKGLGVWYKGKGYDPLLFAITQGGRLADMNLKIY